MRKQFCPLLLHLCFSSPHSLNKVSKAHAHTVLLCVIAITADPVKNLIRKFKQSSSVRLRNLSIIFLEVIYGQQVCRNVGDQAVNNYDKSCLPVSFIYAKNFVKQNNFRVNLDMHICLKTHAHTQES